MQRFYHSKRPLFLIALLFLIIFLFLKPLLPYLPKATSLGRDFVKGSTRDLRQKDGRTSILILGLGGPKNEPSGLTDTIIFASVSHSGETLLLSLPRDIWIPQIAAKINTAYYYGNRSEGVGLEWARQYVSEITGQPVHYVVVVSFDGFVEVVDILGGVDVLVERSFVDERYPIPGKENDNCNGDPMVACRYETVSFAGGMQHFTGEEALKFVRSRSAQGPEGTDFARSARQQKIILALREKVLSPKTLLNPEKLDRILEVIGRSVESDIPEAHFAPFGKLAIALRGKEIRSEVVDGGLLVNPPNGPKYGNQWVLVPKDDSWEKTAAWVKCLLSGDTCPIENF